LVGQQNQKSCIDYLIPKIIEKKPITLSLIKEIHLLLTQGMYYDNRGLMESGERSGNFKLRNHVIGAKHVGESPENVEDLLTELLEEVNGAEGTPLKIGAYLDAKFEYITPFADGNGRVGRTLLNYYLLQNGHPPIIIYDNDKTHYHQALEVFNKEENLEPLCKILEHQLTKTWEREIINYTKERSIAIA